MTFNETREDLGHGLTRRRPRPGEADWDVLNRMWIYECTFSLSTQVDGGAPSFETTQGYVRSVFAERLRHAADVLENGDS